MSLPALVAARGLAHGIFIAGENLIYVLQLAAALSKETVSKDHICL